MVYGNREGVMSSSHSPEDVKMKKSDPFVIEFDWKTLHCTSTWQDIYTNLNIHACRSVINPKSFHLHRIYYT